MKGISRYDKGRDIAHGDQIQGSRYSLYASLPGFDKAEDVLRQLQVGGQVLSDRYDRLAVKFPGGFSPVRVDEVGRAT